MAELEVQYSELELKLGDAQARAADIGREVTKAEDAVAHVQARIQKDQGLLDSGSITVAKQLEELQHEVATLERRQGELEDEQLEVMEAAEEADTAVEDLTAQAAQVSAGIEAARANLQQAQTELGEQVEAADQQRAQLIDAVGLTELGKLYSKLRVDHGGVVAALLAGDRCGACNLQLSPIELTKLKDSDEDEVHRCDECRSILVLGGES